MAVGRGNRHPNGWDREEESLTVPRIPTRREKGARRRRGMRDGGAGDPDERNKGREGYRAGWGSSIGAPGDRRLARGSIARDAEGPRAGPAYPTVGSLRRALANERCRSDETGLLLAAPGFQHVLDHPVAGSAISARAARPRDLEPGGRTRVDRLSDLALRHGVANANVHPGDLVDHMILNAIIISNPLQVDSRERAKFRGVSPARTPSFPYSRICCPR